MNRGTIILVAAALATAGGAYAMRPQPLPEAQFEDTGEALFEGFTDPSLATSLSVIAWDEENASVQRFAVEQKEGRWVIPSHNDYPADGTERMGKAAASFIDVKKDVYYGDTAEEHGAFGLLDPEGSEGKGDEKGQRITIKDASGTVLVDVIVGKQIPDKQGMYYVRKPEEKRVYGARLQLDISTTFGDWIEKDLLHVERDEIARVEYSPYHVDESQGRVVGADTPIVATKEDGGEAAAEAWKAVPPTPIPAGKELDELKLKQIVTAVANLKIVGVRPRPAQLTRAHLPLLQSKGFFVTGDGRLMGNEGQIAAVTQDGLVYTLYFGEVTFESGIALTAGADEVEGEAGKPPEEAKAPEEPKAPDDPTAEGGENKDASRYMFVDVRYDPALDKSGPTPPPTPEGEPPTTPPVDPVAAAKGAERADKLRKRFDQWFYVISDQSFKQIHKPREELFKAPAADGPKKTP